MLLLSVLVAVVITCQHVANGQQRTPDHPPPIVTDPERLSKLRTDAIRLALFRKQLREALLSKGLNMKAANPDTVFSHLKSIDRLGNYRVKPIDLTKNPAILKRLRQRQAPIVVLNPRLMKAAERFSKGTGEPFSPVPVTGPLPRSDQGTVSGTRRKGLKITAPSANRFPRVIPIRMFGNKVPSPPPTSNPRQKDGTFSNKGLNQGVSTRQQTAAYQRVTEVRQQSQQSPDRRPGNVPVPMPQNRQTTQQMNRAGRWRQGRRHQRIQIPSRLNKNQIPSARGRARGTRQRPGLRKQKRQPRPHTQEINQKQSQSILSNAKVDIVDDVGKGNGTKKPTSKEVSDHQKNKGLKIDDGKKTQGKGKPQGLASSDVLEQLTSIKSKLAQTNPDTLHLLTQTDIVEQLKSLQSKTSNKMGSSSLNIQGILDQVKSIQKLAQKKSVRTKAITKPATLQTTPSPTPSLEAGLPVSSRNLKPIPMLPSKEGFPKPQGQPSPTMKGLGQSRKLVIPIPNVKQAMLPGPPKLILPLPGIAGPSGRKNVSLGNRPSLMLPIRIKLSGPAALPLTVRFDAPPVIYLRLHLEFPGGLKIPFRVPVSIDGLTMPRQVNVGLGMDVVGEGRVMMPNERIVKKDKTAKFNPNLLVEMAKHLKKGPKPGKPTKTSTRYKISQSPQNTTLKPHTHNVTATATAAVSHPTTKPTATNPAPGKMPKIKWPKMGRPPGRPSRMNNQGPVKFRKGFPPRKGGRRKQSWQTTTTPLPETLYPWKKQPASHVIATATAAAVTSYPGYTTPKPSSLTSKKPLEPTSTASWWRSWIVDRTKSSTILQPVVTQTASATATATATVTGTVTDKPQNITTTEPSGSSPTTMTTPGTVQTQTATATATSRYHGTISHPLPTSRVAIQGQKEAHQHGAGDPHSHIYFP